MPTNEAHWTPADDIAPEPPDPRLVELTERLKELRCLYAISMLTEHREAPLDQLLLHIIEAIPPAWQHPESAEAAIVYDGVTYATDGYRPSPWYQEALVIVSGAAVGSLIVCYTEEHPPCDEGPFLEEERDLLNVLAQRIGEILERLEREAQLLRYRDQLRSLARQLITTEERERRRMAEEVHDRIAQMLVSMKLKLMMALKQEMAPRGRSQVEQTVELLQQTIDDTRSLIFDLSPPLLHDLGLGGALEWAAEQARARADFDLELDLAAGIPILDEETATAVFKSCRELLANIVTHASARTVSIVASWEGSTWRLQVTDDGRGFDVDKAREAILKEGHFGLFSCKERISLLGGAVIIESEPGRGTSITIRIPSASKPNHPEAPPPRPHHEEGA